MRFLHAADLHLGLRLTRFGADASDRIGEARFTALDQLRAKAAELRVDFILVAGDVFDDLHVSASIARRAYEQFNSGTLNCPTYLIPGNHDPLVAGGVWDREPWCNANVDSQRVRLLRDREPVAVPGLSVLLFPCPVRERTSTVDPTAWIAEHPRSQASQQIRIGIAHGSLNIMPQLAPDDHLIRADAAGHLGLDYLALGHWHKPTCFSAADGAERTAYCGTHEPMRFPGLTADESAGWQPYSNQSANELFEDGGKGTVHLVEIAEPTAPPIITPIEVGRLRWVAERRTVSGRPIGELVSEYAKREFPERTLLRLVLDGVLPPEEHARLGDELAAIVKGRFHAGSSLDADAVLVEPSPAQLTEMLGEGVLARMHTRLLEEAAAPQPELSVPAKAALRKLYQLAWEAHAV